MTYCRAVGTYLEVGGGASVLTRPNCKLFTCQLVLVAAAPVLQDFHPGEKVGGGGGPHGLWFLRPCVVIQDAEIVMIIPKHIPHGLH